MSDRAPRLSIRPIRRWICFASTAIVFAIACCFPGWLDSGLAIGATALFGLLALLAHAILHPTPRWTIRRMLVLVSLSALAFAGWNLGLRESRARVAMVAQVNVSGGSYFQHLERLHGWVLGDDGMMLPEQVESWLGEGAVGTVTRLTINDSMFTVENLRDWPLRQLESLTFQPRMSVNQGPLPMKLDLAAWQTLSRVAPELRSLDLRRTDLDQVDWAAVAALPLENLWLDFGANEIRIDERLAKCQSLKMVIMIKGKMTARTMEELAVLPGLTDVRFHQSVHAMGGGEPPVSFTVRTFNFNGTKLSSPDFEWLAKFSSLLALDLRGSSYLPDDVERFRELRPEVTVWE